MASMDALVEIAVYIGGGIAILAVLAHIFKPPMEGGGLPPVSNAGSTGCGCGQK